MEILEFISSVFSKECGIFLAMYLKMLPPQRGCSLINANPPFCQWVKKEKEGARGGNLVMAHFDPSEAIRK